MKSYTERDCSNSIIHGFELVRVKGSHHVYVNRETGKRTVVPMHNQDLKKGTLHGILKQAGIERLNLLKFYIQEP